MFNGEKDGSMAMFHSYFNDQKVTMDMISEYEAGWQILILLLGFTDVVCVFATKTLAMDY